MLKHYSKLFVLLILLCSSLASAQEEPEYYRLLQEERPNLFEIQEAYDKYYETHEWKKDDYFRAYRSFVRAYDPSTFDEEGYALPSVESNTITAQTRSARIGGDWRALPVSINRDDCYYTGQNGVISAIALHPTNANTIYAAGLAGGIWRSRDKGVNWSNSLVSNIPRLGGINNMAIARSNGNYVYAATDAGIARSTDGVNFRMTSIDYRSRFPNMRFPGDDFRSEYMFVDVAHNNPNKVVATDYNLDNGIESRVAVSTDGGQTWTRKSFGKKNLLLDVRFHPTNSNIIYVLVLDNATRTIRFHRSTDSGRNFTRITSGFPNYTNPDKREIRARLSVTPAQPNLVAFYLNVSTDGSTFYKSTNSGASFTRTCCGGTSPLVNKSNRARDFFGEGFSSTQIRWATTLTVSETDANFVAAATNVQPRFSSDQMRTWYWDGSRTSIPARPRNVSKSADRSCTTIHGDIKDMIIRGNDVWVAGDGGLVLSENKGRTFTERADGIPITMALGFDMTQGKDDVILVAMDHNGVMVRDAKNYGNQWKPLGGGDAHSATINPVENLWVYAHPSGPVVFQRPNVGPTHGHPRWTNSPIRFGNGYRQRFNNVQVHPNLHNTLYSIDYVTNSVQRSTDNGGTWQQIRKLQTNSHSYSEVKVSFSNPKVLYVADRAGITSTLHRSTDEGRTWGSILPSNIPSGYRIRNIEIDSEDHNIAWLTLNNSREPMVFKTTDGGRTWTDYSASLGGHQIFSIVHQKGSNEGVYIGTRNGVYFRDKGMSSWSLFGRKLPGTRINYIKINYAKGLIRVGTSNGIFETPLANINSPQANIAMNRNVLNPGGRVNFSDYSAAGMDATYSWSFPGGSPSTSTSRKPVVTYRNNGTYSVSLTVRDSRGSNTTTFNSINVGSGTTIPEIVNGTFYIRSKTSGQNMITSFGSNHEVFMADREDIRAHQWEFRHLGNGQHTIKNVNSNRYLEVPGAACSNGADVGTFTSATADHHRWQIELINGNYYLKPIHCLSRALDKRTGNDGENLIQSFSATNGNQQFDLVSISMAPPPPPPPPVASFETVNGTFYIRSKTSDQNMITSFISNHEVFMADREDISAHQWVFRHLGDGQHTIKNVNSNRYLEVPGGACSNGADVGTFTSASADHHKWQIELINGNYFLKPIHCSTRALDKRTGNDGENTIYAFSTTNGNQQFDLIPISAVPPPPPPPPIVSFETINGTFYIRSKTSDQNMITSFSSNHEVFMADREDIRAHQWVFRHLGNGQHTIKNVNSNRYLEVPGGACSNSADVGTFTAANADHHKWQIELINGNYYLKPIHCLSRALDKRAGNDGENLIYAFSTTNGNQQFDLIPISAVPPPPPPPVANFETINGTFYIRSKTSDQNMITSFSSNHEVFMADREDIRAHQWVFRHLGDGQHTIKNVNSNRYLEVPNGRCTNGADVGTFTSASADHHKWQIELINGNYYLKPIHCLSRALDKQTGNDGENLLHTFSATNGNQQFNLVPIFVLPPPPPPPPVANFETINGTFYIRSKTSDQNMITSFSSNHEVFMADREDIRAHQWVFRHLGDGQHTIKNVNSNRYLEVPGGACRNGADVGTFTSASADHHKWQIELINGNYYLKPVHCLSRALDNRTGNDGENTIYAFGTTNGNQQFDLIPLSTSNACQLHDSEDFESDFGIWNDGGVDASLGEYTQSVSGRRAVRLRDNSGQRSSIFTDVIDFRSAGSVVIRFNYEAFSMERSEDFFLEVSSDGGSSYTRIRRWVRGTDFENGQALSVEEVIPDNLLSSRTVIRLRCDASGNGDQIYIDDIEIETCGSSVQNSNGDKPNSDKRGLSSSELKEDQRLRENAESNQYSLFPNPSSDEIMLKTNDRLASAMIIDRNGKQHGKLTLNEKQSISELQSGVYYIVIRSEGNIRILKFIKI